jgi:hypothetical protein
MRIRKRHDHRATAGRWLRDESRRCPYDVGDAIHANEIVRLARGQGASRGRRTDNRRTDGESGRWRRKLVEQLSIAGQSPGEISVVARETTCRADRVCWRERGIQRDAVAVTDDERAAVREGDFDACTLLGDECFTFAKHVAGVQLAQPSGGIERENGTRHGSDGGDFGTRGHQIKPGPRCDTGMIALNAARSYAK